MSRILKRQSGITFPEILVIILLLGIVFSSAAIFAVAQINKARDAKRKSDLENIKIALYDYYFDINCFPKNLPQCGQPLEHEGAVYLDAIPCDPGGEDYGYQSHCSDECSQWFMVLANLENENDSGIEKVGCQFGCGPPDCGYNYGLSSSNIKVNYRCTESYVCAPGGSCEFYERPDISQCPRLFGNDPTCQDLCSDKSNWCKNASGKSVPDKWGECEYE